MERVTQSATLSLPKDLSIETARCRLRIPSESDIPHVFSATRHPGFNDGMLWDPPATIEELHEPLKRSIDAWERGVSYTFSIDQIAGGAFIGRIGIRQTAEGGVWSIGYWTHPDQQGKGFMSEVVPAILRFGFETLHARRIEAAYALWNAASKKILERAGMTFMRHEPQGFQKHGVWVAEDVLAIEKDSWLGRSE